MLEPAITCYNSQYSPNPKSALYEAVRFWQSLLGSFFSRTLAIFKFSLLNQHQWAKCHLPVPTKNAWVISFQVTAASIGIIMPRLAPNMYSFSVPYWPSLYSSVPSSKPLNALSETTLLPENCFIPRFHLILIERFSTFPLNLAHVLCNVFCFVLRWCLQLYLYYKRLMFTILADYQQNIHGKATHLRTQSSI